MQEIIKYGKLMGQPLEWIVLQVWEKERKALVISKYGLFTGFFDENRNPSWANSGIRELLNKDMLTSLFTVKEQQGIIPVKLPREKADLLESDDYDTYDCLFCLSAREAERYFPLDEDRKTTCLSGKNTRGSAAWWLRSRIAGENSVAYVNRTGRINTNGHLADEKSLCMRPAFYLDLSVVPMN